MKKLFHSALLGGGCEPPNIEPPSSYTSKGPRGPDFCIQIANRLINNLWKFDRCSTYGSWDIPPQWRCRFGSIMIKRRLRRFQPLSRRDIVNVPLCTEVTHFPSI